MWRKTAKNNVGHKGSLREVKLRKVKKKRKKNDFRLNNMKKTENPKMTTKILYEP